MEGAGREAGALFFLGGLSLSHLTVPAVAGMASWDEKSKGRGSHNGRIALI